jgi:hypothetical protein
MDPARPDLLTVHTAIPVVLKWIKRGCHFSVVAFVVDFLVGFPGSYGFDAAVGVDARCRTGAAGNVVG